MPTYCAGSIPGSLVNRDGKQASKQEGKKATTANTPSSSYIPENTQECTKHVNRLLRMESKNITKSFMTSLGAQLDLEHQVIVDNDEENVDDT